LVRGLSWGDIGDWPAPVKGPTGPSVGRLIAVKRGAAAAKRVRVRRRRRAKHNKQTVAPATLELAGYVLLWATLPKEAHAK
jgi:hypothetical protein